MTLAVLGFVWAISRVWLCRPFGDVWLCYVGPVVTLAGDLSRVWLYYVGRPFGDLSRDLC